MMKMRMMKMTVETMKKKVIQSMRKANNIADQFEINQIDKLN